MASADLSVVELVLAVVGVWNFISQLPMPFIVVDTSDKSVIGICRERIETAAQTFFTRGVGLALMLESCW